MDFDVYRRVSQQNNANATRPVLSDYLYQVMTIHGVEVHVGRKIRKHVYECDACLGGNTRRTINNVPHEQPEIETGSLVNINERVDGGIEMIHTRYTALIGMVVIGRHRIPSMRQR